jgi:hypothetical protein
MLVAPAQTVFAVITDFLASEPKPEDILAFHLPSEMEMYAAQLLERRREQGLTQDEELDLYDFIRADDMMTLLKTKTRLKHSKA